MDQATFFDGNIPLVSGITFSVCVALFFVSTPFFSRLSSHYRTLKPNEQADWNSRSASTVHAIVTTILPAYLLYTDSELLKNTVTYFPTIAGETFAISFGYLLADLFVVLTHIKEFGVAISLQTLLHHSIGVLGFFLILKYKILTWFIAVRLFSEASTPLVNIRWMLSKNPAWKHSALYTVNGILMAVAFFVVRVGVLPYYYLVLYSSWADLNRELSPWQIGIFVGFGFVIDCLNVFWMSKIFNGVVSMFKKKAV